MTELNKPNGDGEVVAWRHKDTVIPFANVHHTEGRRNEYIMVVMNGTTYNDEQGEYNNAVSMPKADGELFIAAWMDYLRANALLAELSKEEG